MANTKFEHITFPRSRSWRLTRPMGDAAPPSCDEAERTNWDDENAAFLRWLFARFELDIRMYRVETLQRRMAACLRVCNADNAWQARRALERDGSLAQPAISTLLLGVTSFFRDTSVFEQLNRSVLPALAAQREYLRVWSIGCSDGAEVYSVAMLLAEHDLLNRSYLVGSDCRLDALARARRGMYDLAAVRQVPAHLAAKYLVLDQGLLKVASPLRMAARWWPQDALNLCQSSVWDLILCRNMAMYLTATAAAKVWRMLADSLRPGGTLVLGKAERPTNGQCFNSIGQCIYERTRG